jgi:hypothetical protein
MRGSPGETGWYSSVGCILALLSRKFLQTFFLSDGKSLPNVFHEHGTEFDSSCAALVMVESDVGARENQFRV